MIKEKVRMGENIVAIVTKANGTRKVYETKPSTKWRKLKRLFKW